MTLSDYEQLYSSFFTDLLRIAYRVTFDTESSEDLCQEAFIRLYDRLANFPSQNDAKYWLIRVVKNLSINHYKRRKNEYQVIEKVKREPTASHKGGEQNLIEKEAKEYVSEALQQIPAQFREVLILREFSNLNYKEIAKALNTTEGNVKVRAFRGRAILEKILKEKNYE